MFGIKYGGNRRLQIYIDVLWAFDYCDGLSDARTIFVEVYHDFFCKIEFHVCSVWSFWLLVIIGAPH